MEGEWKYFPANDRARIAKALELGLEQHNILVKPQNSQSNFKN